MSNKCKVTGPKSSVAPVLRKLYDTHKRWLGNDLKGLNTKKETKVIYGSFGSEKKTDLVFVHKTKECTFRSFIEKDDLVEKDGDKIARGQTVPNPRAVPSDQKNDTKLRLAIDNFDKILDEYGKDFKKDDDRAKKTPTKIPKLQKSNTCSIIESRCVLKKSISVPLDKNHNGDRPEKFNNDTKVLVKTKSLHDITDRGVPNEPNASKVKEAINKINNFDKHSKSLIPRAVSVSDLCQQKKLSKIPVKAYPSTPTNLNHLDCLRGRTKSANINDGKLTNRFSKSAQNLSNRKACKRDFVSDIGRTVQNLDRTKSKCVEKNIDIPKSDGGKSFVNNSECVINTKSLNMVAVSNSMDNTKSTSDKIVHTKSPCFAKIVDIPIEEEKIDIKATLNNCLNKSNRLLDKIEVYTKNKPPVATHTRNTIKLVNQTNVKSVVEKLEGERNYATYRKDTKNLVCAQDTFGMKKLLVEPKFGRTADEAKKISLVRSETYTKTKTKVIQLDDIKIDLKRARDLVQSFKAYQIDQKEEERAPMLDKDVEIVDVSAEKKGYSSDDASDDSGNISNDLDGDETMTSSPMALSSSRSHSSVESLISAGNNGGGDKNETLVIYELDDAEQPNDDNKIFFRSGVLTQLEAQRDEKLAGMVVNLQAHCRGHLARKRLVQKKLQDVAVRCIQRNVRKFMLVRDWPWWRLLVRVTPLLNVHRTEEELKSKTEELEVLKSKLEKLEAERTTLKHENDKLEAKVSRKESDDGSAEIIPGGYIGNCFAWKVVYIRHRLDNIRKSPPPNRSVFVCFSAIFDRNWRNS